MVATLERMMQQATLDPDFRSEAKKRGVRDLPMPVEGQDQEFFELVDDGMSAIDIMMCGSSCSSGPWTVVCDGGTK